MILKNLKTILSLLPLNKLNYYTMKKSIFLAGLIFFYVFSNAQVFDFENFENYDEGNFFPTVNPGFFVGPNQWRGYAYDSNIGGEETSNNLGVDNFQIIEQNNNKRIKLLSPNNNTGFRQIYKNGFADAWNNRTDGNNVLKVNFNIELADAEATSKVQVHVSASSEYSYMTLAGIAFSTNTHKVTGLMREYNPETGQIQINDVSLGTEDIIYEPNTEYTISFAYDYTTKKVTWYCETLGIDKSEFGDTDVEPYEVDIYLSSLESPANPNMVYIDDIKQEFSDNSNFVVGLTNELKENVNIYPNPVDKILNVDLSNFDTYNTVLELQNLTGKTIFKTAYTNQIDMSILSKGVYLLKISDNKHLITKKIVKL